jgi:hypothetical protein
MLTVDFIEELLHLAKANIFKAIIARRGFYIAVSTGQITQGASIKPKGLQLVERHTGPSGSVRGDKGVGKLLGVGVSVNAHNGPGQLNETAISFDRPS